MSDIGYGDVVRVLSDAPIHFMPGATGSVCSIFVINERSYAEKLRVPLGTTLIGIEEEDGTFFELPIKYVRKEI